MKETIQERFQDLGFTYESACFDDEGRMWFFSHSFNGLFYVNCDSKEVYFVTSIKEYSFFQSSLFGGLAYHGGKIILAPLIADSIIVYYITKNEYISIPVIPESSSYYRVPKMFAITIQDDFAFIVGLYFPAIIKMNLLSLEISLFEIPTDMRYAGNLERLFNHDIAIKDATLYLPCRNKNCVLIYDLKKNSILSKKIKCSDERGFSGICISDGIVFLTSNWGGVVTVWIPENGDVEELVLDNGNNNERSYVGCYAWNDNVVLNPSSNNQMCIINKKNHEPYFVDIEKRTGIQLGSNVWSKPVFYMASIGDLLLLELYKNGTHLSLSINEGNVIFDHYGFLNVPEIINLEYHGGITIRGDRQGDIRFEEGPFDIRWFLRRTKVM